jgi:hypothetical protein
MGAMTTSTGSADESHTGSDDTLTRWRLDQLHARVDRLVIPVREAVQAAMAGLRAAMESRKTDRYVDPDAPIAEDDDIRRLAGIIERLAQRPGGYNEAPKDGSLKAVIIGCTIAIVSAGIIAAFTLSNQFAEFRGQVIAWQIAADKTMAATSQRLDRLENRRP